MTICCGNIVEFTSAIMIPANGPRKIVNPLMNVSNPEALPPTAPHQLNPKCEFSGAHLARICHGQRAHPPNIAHITCPRRILIQRGAIAVISLPALSKLAEMFVPSVARANEKATKNAAGRFVQRSMRCIGSQRVTPYSDWPAAVTASPTKAVRVKTMGMMAN
jgi:hypothetical protein